MEPEARVSLELLTGINLDDLVAAFGWEHRPLLRSLLRRAFAGPARGFAAQRMCPFCGLITSRTKTFCLECGKSLAPVASR